MKIESFEKGCEITGRNPSALPIVDHLLPRDQKAQIATYKLFVISDASWKGDKLAIDWNNPKQYKWEPIAYMRKDKSNPTGFRFGVSCFAFASTITDGGSRLCYPSEEESDYHFEQHIDLYRDLMVIEVE